MKTVNMADEWPNLKALVQEAIAKGLPMPINWVIYSDEEEDSDYSSEYDDSSDQEEECTDSTSSEDQESDQDETEDSDSPDTQESEGEGEPEENEAQPYDDQSTNDQSKETSSESSTDDDGQEDHDSDDQSGTEPSESSDKDEGEDGEGTGESTEPSEETGEGNSSEASENATEQDGTEPTDGAGDGTESSEDGEDTSDSTSENQGTEGRQDADEAETQDTAESNSNSHDAALRAVMEHLQQAVVAEERYEMSAEDKRVMKKIYEAIVEICKLSVKGVKTNQTNWDIRALSRDVCCGRDERVLRDRRWAHRPRRLALFWDQSGSCDQYFPAIANAIKEMAKFGYRCWLYDCSNGIAETESLVFRKTRSDQTDEDQYDNGPRLREVAKKLNCRIDGNIIKPNADDFIKICQQADTTIVIQDYDNVQSIWLPARKITMRKCPYFIDLDRRYEHPSQHTWNKKLRYGDDYPVPDRWYKIMKK